MEMITEKELCGITEGPIPIRDFLGKDWKTLYLPNGHGRRYKPTDIDFFGSCSYCDGMNRPQAHLDILIALIQKWKEHVKDAEIYAVLLFGSSVRIPKKIFEDRGMWWWKKQVKVNEKIYPNDIDVLLITNISRQQIAEIRHRSWPFSVGDGSCSWTEYIYSMGFDINGMTEREFTEILGDFDHECHVPYNVLKEGVLIAGDCEFSGLLGSKRRVIWHEHHAKCMIQ